jgi:diacylglycerol kinase (ATP)
VSGSHPEQRVAVIANPASGRGAGAVRLRSALEILRARGIHPRALPTERPGHAIELARTAAAEGADLVIALGGDGTVRDVVEGLGDGDLALGIVPGGTGNDLARSLGIPRELEPALRTAVEGGERRLDVWLWSDTPFLNVVGLGLDAAVARAVNERFRRLKGTAAYVAALAATLPGFRPFALSLQWPEGEWSGRAWLAAFANARCYGGGMQIAPAAVPDDGLLDVIVVEDVSKLELLRQFPGIFSGRHVKHPRVRSFRVSRVEVEAEEQAVTVDGELIARAPASVIRAGYSLRVRVPRS